MVVAGIDLGTFDSASLCLIHWTSFIYDTRVTFLKLFNTVYFAQMIKNMRRSDWIEPGTLDLKASTLSIWPLALLINGTLSALPYDSYSECLKILPSPKIANWLQNDIVLQSVCYFGTCNISNIQNLNDIVLQSVCYFGT